MSRESVGRNVELVAPRPLIGVDDDVLRHDASGVETESNRRAVPNLLTHREVMHVEADLAARLQQFSGVLGECLAALADRILVDEHALVRTGSKGEPESIDVARICTLQ